MIFICSPYRGDTVRNILRAQEYCRKAVDEGYMPIAPHLFFPQFMDDASPEERTLGITFGLALLDLCDEIWVFGKPTEGMIMEIVYAYKHHIPVRYYPTEGMNPTEGDRKENNND